MKYLATSIFIMLTGLFNIIYAQSNNWEWAKSADGSSSDHSSSITTDASGNVYVTGSFQSDTITFDAITLINNGSTDMFIAKYDANGNTVWAKSAGGSSSDHSSSITTDASGNVYVTGSFQSDTIYFETIALSSISGGRETYLVKYDENGNVVWAKGSSSVSSHGNDITTDTAGNVYIIGECYYFSLTFDTIVFPSNGMFCVKFDTDGNAIWIKGTETNASGSSINSDAQGNVYITGDFGSKSIVFGSDTLTSNSSHSMYVVKYDSNGNIVWARGSDGGTYFGSSNSSIASDGFGNVYVAGTFHTTTMVFDTITLTNMNNGSVYIVKYDVNGSVVWAKNQGGNLYDVNSNLTLDATGNIYVSGYFSSDSIIFGSHLLINNGGHDLYIMKYDVNGNSIWAKSAGGMKSDVATDLAIDAAGNIYITGSFESNPLSFGSNSLTNNGIRNVFLAKLSMTTSVEELKPIKTFKFYPNPFSASTTIEFDNKNKAKHTLTIYNTTGQLVRRIDNITTGRVKIERENLNSGLYFLLLMNNTGSIRKGKIIVE